MTVSDVATVYQKTKTVRHVDLEQNGRQKLVTAVYKFDSTAVSNPGSSILTVNQQAHIVQKHGR